MGGWCGPSFTTASIRRERHEHRYPQVNKSWSQPIPGFVEGRLASGEHRMKVMANALTVLTTIALGLSAGAIVPDRVPGELRRYSRWHWARTVLAVGAFVSAVISLLSVGSTPAG